VASRRGAGAAAIVAFAALACAGCGYVGEPLPPLLHIPVRIDDLTAVERGGRIIVQFTLPTLTTEGTVLREPPALDLRIGAAPDPWNADAWAAQATPAPQGAVEKGRVRYEIPVDGWTGKHVFIAVRAIGESGRDSGWSNYADFVVLPPLATPANVRAEAVETGVKLSWQGGAPVYRVYRRAPDAESFAPAADTTLPEWTDTQTAYGKPYAYRVKALSATGARAAESEMSAEANITPVDRFAPQPPAGLTAVAATASVALVWERNSEPDFAAFRVCRAEGDGPLQPVAETGVTPSYNDRTVEAGKRYRYSVTAVDAAGNESRPAAPVEVVAQ
jgi:hypothetical protein